MARQRTRKSHMARSTERTRCALVNRIAARSAAGGYASGGAPRAAVAKAVCGLGKPAESNS